MSQIFYTHLRVFLASGVTGIGDVFLAPPAAIIRETSKETPMNIVETDYQPRDFDVYVKPSFRGGDSGINLIVPRHMHMDGSKMIVVDPAATEYERPSICINGSDLAEAANTCDLVGIEEGFTLDSFVVIRKVSADVCTIEFRKGDEVPKLLGTMSMDAMPGTKLDTSDVNPIVMDPEDFMSFADDTDTFFRAFPDLLSEVVFFEGEREGCHEIRYLGPDLNRENPFEGLVPGLAAIVADHAYMVAEDSQVEFGKKASEDGDRLEVMIRVPDIDASFWVSIWMTENNRHQPSVGYKSICASSCDSNDPQVVSAMNATEVALKKTVQHFCDVAYKLDIKTDFRDLFEAGNAPAL